MALVDADFNNIGETFEIQLDPVSQIVSFDSFTDSVTGETVDAFLTKEFRYGTDGVSWSAWTPVTNPNLNAISTNPLMLYYIEVRYQRAGTDPSGVITWNSWILNATIDPTVVTTFCPAVFSIDNIFCSLRTNDPLFNQLCGNLLDKVVKYGIVPKYISDEDGFRTDDYKDFWKSVCCWLSLHFVFAKQFADIYTTLNLIISFLRQRGVYVCGDEDLIELQQIANTYYNGIRHRGTQEADEEIKRLLCVGDCDEFIFALMRRFEGGSFTVDRSSPLYKGNIGIHQTNKMIEKTDDILDLNNYHIVGSLSTVTTTKNDGTSVEAINIVSATTTAGIAANRTSDKKMVVDPNLNYEISFFVKMPVVTGSILSFGVDSWDCDGVNRTLTENILTGTDDRWFFQEADVIKQTSDFVQVRGIIWNQSEPLKTSPDELLSFGYGSNLRFKSGQDIGYIYPKILIQDGISVPLNNTLIYGVKVNVVSNPYSLGFVNLANFLITYFKNNNDDLSMDDIKKIVDKDLIPANTTISNIVEL
jgi:hypothetical protein